MKLFMADTITSLREVFVDQLKDLYSAETLIAKALPKLAKAATSPDLKNGFTAHLKQTKEHAARIKAICAALKEKPTGKTCQATVGLVKEGQEAIDEDALPELKDLMLIAAARRVEHYEISGYTSASELATTLGLKAAAKALSTTLAEETATDEKLAKASVPAVAKAQAAEKKQASKKTSGTPEISKGIRNIVKKITG
jgi:ferritin-like metal-binding protein YciE